MKNPTPAPAVRAVRATADFARRDAAGGILIIAATVIALIWANSPWQGSYHSVWHAKFDFPLGVFSPLNDVHKFVNDALMSIFFFIVGLEIRHEMTDGHLSTAKTRAMPVIAAVAGMVFPAVAYLLIAGGTDARGWGVPMATDIALAVGVISLLGHRVPSSFRAFLLGLAVIDDIGAILVIAVFYSSGVSVGWLVAAVAIAIVMTALNRRGAETLLVYLAGATALWVCLHEAGIHPTIAGVIAGMLVPNHTEAFERVENAVRVAVVLLVVPVFALANAGVELSTDVLGDALSSPVAWGIFVGLVIGKPLGIFVAVKSASRARIAEEPEGSNTGDIIGIGSIAGIGFTVALFIAQLAFEDADRLAAAQVSIFAASLVSAIFGALFTAYGGRRSSLA